MVSIGQNVTRVGSDGGDNEARGVVGRVTPIAQVYRAGCLGGLWGVIGPKGFVGCTGWTYAECAGRARAMNVALAGLERAERNGGVAEPIRSIINAFSAGVE